ncbi:MAG: thiamine diphosphokinase [Breznakia sp.]
MKRVLIVSSNAKKIINIEVDAYIGVEKGAILLHEQDYPIDIAIGDFDSISEKEKKTLANQYKILELPSHKNESDSECALRYAFQHYDEVFICGVSGGRLDHFIAIYNMLAYQDVRFTILDDQNCIYKLKKGIHKLLKRSKYVSLFALAPSKISIQGVAYPLSEQQLDEKDVYTISNEVIGEAILEIKYGVLMIVESNDD